MKNSAFKILGVVLIITLIVLSLRYNDNGKEDEAPKLSYAHISGKIILIQPHQTKNLSDISPKYYNYQYDNSPLINENDIQNIVSLFDQDVPILSFWKKEMNGEINYFFKEGEKEYKRFIQLTESGKIHYDNKKMLGFTYEISEDNLLDIANRTLSSVSPDEEFRFQQTSLLRVAKYDLGYTTTDIGSYYWVSYYQVLDGISIRGTSLSVDIRDGEVVGYNEFRYFSDRMTKIDILPELYSPLEASEFALDHISKEYRFNKEDLKIGDWDLMYGFDEESGLITPIYGFHVEKEYRTYWTTVHADIEFGGKMF